MAPLVHLLRKSSIDFKTTVCVTAQHREMLDQVLSIFDITPDIDLNIMAPGQDLYDLTSSILLSMRDVLKSKKPDVVLVHGDTTTAMATALAAFYAGIPVAHVESGLRTNNLSSPFPEEFNRQIVGKIATYHFAPTQLCKENLIAERVPADLITVSGNTVIDALQLTLNNIEKNEELKGRLTKQLRDELGYDWTSKKYILITGHRRENFGEGFIEICNALKELSMSFPEMHFIYPVHLNPNVQGPVNSVLGELGNVHLITPQSYESFVLLLNNCYLVLTDSGGIQEEAPSLGKPVLLMRNTTERPEALSEGTVELVGANRAGIVFGVSSLIENHAHYEKMSRAHNPYGDGKAVDRIVATLKAI